jgi:CDP-diacylglycerol--glycerol-3-phosphate 3-phosphatidyltransferase
MNHNSQDTLKKTLKFSKKDLFSIPNILCYIRLLLIPLFVVLYIKAESTSEYFLAAFVVMIASFTDFLDGFIARTFHLVTEFGKFLDPLVDKLMQAALLFVLILKIDYMFLLIILFVVKELTMVVLGYFMLKHGKKLNGAKWFGKISTTVFYVIMLILVAFPNLNDIFVKALMAICGSFLSLSFILYGREYYIMYKELKTNNI